MTAAANPRAAFSLTLDGRDLTAAVRPRLRSAVLTESRGGEADELTLELDDADGALDLPRAGVQVAFGLGWAAGGAPLVPKGLFTVDEVSWKTAPGVISLTACSADFTADLRVRQERSWRDTTLGAVLGDVAAAHGLRAAVDGGLGATALPVLQQSRESDAQLLARLGRRFGAVATVKADRLLFLPIGAGRTAGGAALPGFQLACADGDAWSFKEPARDSYDGVTAGWHDVDGAQRRTVSVGAASRPKRLRRTFATEADATQHAASEHARLQRDAATLSGSLALGRPDLFPELTGRVSGLKPSVSARTWLIAKATHTLDASGGLTTSLELETAPGAGGS